MRLHTKLLLKVAVGCLAITTWSFCPSAVWSQDAFRQAHELVKQWSPAQQAQQQSPSDTNGKKLKEITEAIAQKVPELLKQGILDSLNSPGLHSVAEIHEKIISALEPVPSHDYQPEIYILPVSSGDQSSLLIAYNVPYCASCSRAWIGLIGKTNGRYDVLSRVNSSFDNKSLHVVPIAPNADGGSRFLVYGTNWGDTHTRLSAMAYVANGTQLTEFWARTDLPQGTLTYSANEITLKFLTKVEPPPTGERTEIYAIEPTGIRLKKEFEQPI